MTLDITFANPFRPGAGYMPPYLAGRELETDEFRKLILQQTVLENMVLTGLRGVGKTVLLDTFKPIAIAKNWLWASTDLSESVSVSEVNLATRLLTDLSLLTSNIVVEREQKWFGTQSIQTESKMGYSFLAKLYNNTPGLVLDKLKNILEFVWNNLKNETNIKGLVFAYDEAQNLSDQKKKGQYPLGILLDLFQSIQKKDIPFMLVLTGLPTLFPKLVDSRAFAERMFTIVDLKRLNEDDSRRAILVPIENEKCPVKLTDNTVNLTIKLSAGYPYFIQFICKELYDVFFLKIADGQEPSVPIDEIRRKLDTDFFAGRWARVTNRQRDLLYVIASIVKNEEKFSVQEVVEQAKKVIENLFSSSNVNQMLVTLINSGLVYRNRHGEYSFAVPLLGDYISRQYGESMK